MAKKATKRSGNEADLLGPRKTVRGSSAGVLRAATVAGTTGRFIAIFQPGEAKAGVKALHDKAGVAAPANTADSNSGALDPNQVDGKNVLFDKLDMAVVDLDPDQVGAASAAAGGPVLMLVPETVKSTATVPMQPADSDVPRQPAPAVPGPGGATPTTWPAWPLIRPEGSVLPWSVWPGVYSQDYLRGVVDTLCFLLQGAGFPSLVPGVLAPAPLGTAAEASAQEAAPRSNAAATASVLPWVTAAEGGFDEAALGHTWGLEVMQVIGSSFSGKGVKVAVLDTGLDLNHPDFQGRQITARSFVPGLSAQDGNGHGTYLTGTVCGPLKPETGPRYGIAYEAEIFAGKVMDNGTGLGTQASAKDKWILAGINWAITQGCRVICLTTSGPPEVSNAPYEILARQSLDTTAIIAAAGSGSSRHLGITEPVGVPGNCPSIMAVGAITPKLEVAWFSNRSGGGGGEVDVVGPGMDVYSSWPMPGSYQRGSGTATATAHVAGIAALVAQARPNFTGGQILNTLKSLAEKGKILKDLAEADGGTGLAVAP